MNNYLLKQPKARPLPSGSWRSEVQCNNIRKSFVADSEEEAVRLALVWKLTLEDSTKAKELLQERITLREAIDKYLEDMKESLSPSTVRSYRAMQKYRFKSVMDTHLSADTNWQYVIGEEKKCHVVKVYKDKVIKTDKTVSPKTIKNAWGLVRKVLKYFKLPVPDVILPKKVKKEHEFLEPDEIRIFLKAIEGHRYELPYLLCLHGLRRSEMIVISKSSIVIPKAKDKKPYIRVRGAAVYNEHNQLVEKAENKTVDSARDVPVFIPRLLELVDQMPEGKLCKASPNALINPLNVVLRRNGLPEVGLHGLRHTFASLCYHLQIPTLVTKKWGGWSKKSTVVETIYTHLAEKDEKESLAKMEKFYSELTCL